MASIDEGEDQGSDFIDFIDNNQGKACKIIQHKARIQKFSTEGFFTRGLWGRAVLRPIFGIDLYNVMYIFSKDPNPHDALQFRSVANKTHTISSFPKSAQHLNQNLLLMF